ncbi:MAG: GT4 family glycosyltransferase PelF [Verrucomicrobia bacterium]|nr:GT4 family glycosyltransferase PelF [Verrucomicrobiota bacterium]MBS0646748.1 GT4 family glycosyltransferase PelF [Verrucomicrobiota bacterium]
MSQQEADICIVCEGSYPYTSSGVSQWVHELITEHRERTFHILSLVPLHGTLKYRYTLPSHVIGHTTYRVLDLPKGAKTLKLEEPIWQVLKPIAEGMMFSKSFDNFFDLLSLFRRYEGCLGRRILVESQDAWKFFLDLYQKTIPTGPFKAYFATAFTLMRSLFSIFYPPLPKAKLFHSVCTGYAGLFLYRAKQERQVPCFITEHGIYSNERRIEIAMSDWIVEMGSLDLALEGKSMTLKDFWLNAFCSFAYACYQNCDEVICTFDGNQEIQITGGALPDKVRVIVHGIKQKKEIKIRCQPHDPPTIAFMGRIVPIKGIKTFIRACKLVSQQLPKARFYALGSTEEDADYFTECQKLANDLGLAQKLIFFNHVNLEKFFPEVDLLVLTSLSEAQPLVMLEAGAEGIPCIATDVGACKQLIEGAPNEVPCLGEGGIVTPLVDPDATAQAILNLLSHPQRYQACSEAIARRVHAYYRFEQQHEQYRHLYQNYL